MYIMIMYQASYHRQQPPNQTTDCCWINAYSSTIERINPPQPRTPKRLTAYAAGFKAGARRSEHTSLHAAQLHGGTTANAPEFRVYDGHSQPSARIEFSDVVLGYFRIDVLMLNSNSVPRRFWRRTAMTIVVADGLRRRAPATRRQASIGRKRIGNSPNKQASRNSCVSNCVIPWGLAFLSSAPLTCSKPRTGELAKGPSKAPRTPVSAQRDAMLMGILP